MKRARGIVQEPVPEGQNSEPQEDRGEPIPTKSPEPPRKEESGEHGSGNGHGHASPDPEREGPRFLRTAFGRQFPMGMR